MTRAFSLAWLTAAPLAPPASIDLAHRLGYDAVGVRLRPAAPGGLVQPLIEDTRLRAETKAAIAATGVGIFDVEIVRLDPAFDMAGYEVFLDVAADLGARAVLVAGDDPDESRLTASFAAFCAAAAPRGLTADLEFMPWTAIPNLASARRVVEGSGAANGGILVDALHFARSATTLAEIAALPRGLLHYAQLCDASAIIPATTEELIFDARCERMLPGEGGIDLAGLLAALPDDVPLSLEIPSETRKPTVGIEAWSREAMERARALLGTTAERA